MAKAKEYTGTVRKNDLEGGFLELHTDGGEVYRLSGPQGGVQPRVQPGQRVKVLGRVEHGGFGIHMSGPSLEIERIEQA